ncbi:MAG TPA: TonB-dependent receptor [Opitutaceae bacterium]|nr:TonB-dependent receptor [Opitutaceae bacterium]
MRPVRPTPRIQVLAALAALVILSLPTRGAVPDDASAPVQLPEFFVPGERVGARDLTVPRGDLRPPEPNLGPELLAIPGVYGHARAADAMEPSIRGLGFDRVATTIDGIPLVNASPERTNSPVVILGDAAVTAMIVTKALPSVTQGLVTTGGRIALQTGDAATQPGAPSTTATLTTTYNGARDGFVAQGRFATAAGAWNAGATFFRNDLGDYTAADGRVVAARFDDYGGSAALAWRGGGHQARIAFLQRRLRDQETVSLPLDGRNTESDVLTFNDRWSVDAGALQAIEVRAGTAYTDPYITSEARKAPALTFAQATARSSGGGVTTIWQPAGFGVLRAGADFAGQDRRAVRTTAAGNDYIWPDATYTDVGVFAEWTRSLTPAWRLRLGARGDDVASDARAADRLALGRPIRDQYVAYNGPAAGAVARHDHAGAANALLEWNRNHTVSAFVGAGYSVQPAGVMERYRAFLNALGGDGRGGNAVELGNPALHPERKVALESGGTWRGSWLDLEATAYYYRVDDFILREPVGTTQPPLAPMVVFGYRNTPADFFGTELGATFRPAAGWSIPVTYALSEGRHRDTGVGLSDIPPWEGTIAVRYRGSLRTMPCAVEFRGRVVGARNNPAPLENPLFGATGGFSVWHIRAGIPLGPRVKLEAGIENLLDRHYTEYLTPPVAPFAPASGNLRPGDRVPAPGRSGWVSITLSL